MTAATFLPPELTDAQRRAIRRNLNALPEIRAEIVKRRKAKSRWLSQAQQWVKSQERPLLEQDGKFVVRGDLLVCGHFSEKGERYRPGPFVYCFTCHAWRDKETW